MQTDSPTPFNMVAVYTGASVPTNLVLAEDAPPFNSGDLYFCIDSNEPPIWAYLNAQWVPMPSNNLYVPMTRNVTTVNGLTGGGSLAGDREIGLVVVNPTGTGAKPTVDEFGRVIALSPLGIGDLIDALTAPPVPETRTIIAQGGLAGGGPLSADLILSLSPIQAGTGPRPVVDGYGRVIGTGPLTFGDIVDALGDHPAMAGTQIATDSTMIGGGVLGQNITLGLAPITPAGTGPRASTDAYGRVIGFSQLTPDDIRTGLDYAPMNPTLNLSDLTSPSAARAHLELGTAAQMDAGTPNGLAVLDRNGKVPVEQLSIATIGGLRYLGVWNAFTNVPEMPGASSCPGAYYVIGVAGQTPIDGNSEWQIGDAIISNGQRWEAIRGLIQR